MTPSPCRQAPLACPITPIPSTSWSHAVPWLTPRWTESSSTSQEIVVALAITESVVNKSARHSVVGTLLVLAGVAAQQSDMSRKWTAHEILKLSVGVDHSAATEQTTNKVHNSAHAKRPA